MRLDTTQECVCVCVCVCVCRAMFEDADFQVDETADEYKLLHPNAEDRNRRKREDQELIREHFEQVRTRPPMSLCVRTCLCVCVFSVCVLYITLDRYVRV